MNKKFEKELLFLLIGGLNTILGLFIFWALAQLFLEKIGYQIVLIISFCVSVTTGYLGQALIVFSQNVLSFWKYLKYFLVSLTSFGINFLTLFVLYQSLGADLFLSQIIAVILTTTYSFVGHFFYTFRNRTNDR